MKKVQFFVVLLFSLVFIVAPVSAAPPSYNTWYNTSTGITTPTEVTAIVFSPSYTSDHIVYISTGYGVFRSDDSGFNWTRVGKDVLSVTSVVISPDYGKDKAIYAANSNSVYRMADADVATPDSSWSDIRGDLPQTAKVLAFSPDKELFAGTSNYGLYKTTLINGSSTTWTNVSTQFDLTFNPGITCIVFAPDYSTSHTIFIGLITGAAPGVGSVRGVYRTTNGGNSWTLIANGMLDSDWGHRTVQTLALSPNYLSDHTIFAGLSSAVGAFKSTDGGDNWSFLPETENVSVYAIAISPDYTHDGTVFAGGDGLYNVYGSTNGGSSWSGIDNGFNGRSNIRSLAIPPGQPSQPFNLFAGSAEFWQMLYQGKRSVYLPLVIR